jgi:hypothetical protein
MRLTCNVAEHNLEAKLCVRLASSEAEDGRHIPFQVYITESCSIHHEEKFGKCLYFYKYNRHVSVTIHNIIY